MPVRTMALFLLMVAAGLAQADDYEVPPGTPSSLTICQLNPGERVVIMRTDDLIFLTAFVNKQGVAVFPEIPDGFWAIVEGSIFETWQKEEIPLFLGRDAKYNCFGRARGSP